MPQGAGMGTNSVHLETDVHATKDERYGFAAGAWIHNLDVYCEITEEGDKVIKKTGIMFPMTAKDGPHCTNNTNMVGPGLSLIQSGPISHGFIRHVDNASGVPDWWNPVTVNWTFTCPSQNT